MYGQIQQIVTIIKKVLDVYPSFELKKGIRFKYHHASSSYKTYYLLFIEEVQTH